MGKYTLIGKAPDSEQTYLGNVEIAYKGSQLQVSKVINGHTVTGQAAIESAGETEVLRIRFTDNGKKYEETCLVGADLDNYARISCYLYQPQVETSSPGLEALFRDNSAE